jgi:hypothetical protein
MTETFPMQANSTLRPGAPAQVPKVVALRAYEVYSRVFSPQEALITGNCRGGFHYRELIAFLYARTFPESEWRARVDEALDGLKS